MNKDWPAYCGLFLIGLYCLFSSVFQRIFAHLHIQLPFLDFPVFIGEILLFFCGILLLFHWKMNGRKSTQIHFILFAVFVAWILFKAFWHYSGPLAFRNAALFYYALFAIFGFEFYRNTFFSQRSMITVLFVLLFAKWVIGINNYYVFPYFCLCLILMLRIENRWLCCLAIPFVISRPEYECLAQNCNVFNFLFFFQGSARARLVGHVAALSFLVSILIFQYIKITRQRKIQLLAFIVLIFGVIVFKSADRNALSSMADFSDLFKGYAKLKEQIRLKGVGFEPRALPVQLYSEEENTFSGEVNQHYKFFVPRLNKKEQDAHDYLKENVQKIKDGAQESLKNLYHEINTEREAMIKKVVEQPDGAEAKKIFNTAVQNSGEETAQKILELQRMNNERTQYFTGKLESVEVVPQGHEPNSLKSRQESAKQIEKIARNPQLKESIAKIEKMAEYKKRLYSEKIKSETLDEVSALVEAAGKKGEMALSHVWLLDEDSQQKNEFRNIIVAENNIFFRLLVWADMFKELTVGREWFVVDFSKPQRSKSIEILGWAATEWERDGWITPHNSFIHIIYRAGIVGVALIVFLFCMLITLVRDFIAIRSFVGILLLAVFVYWVVIANFLVFLEFPYNAIPFWTLLGMTLAYREDQKNKIRAANT